MSQQKRKKKKRPAAVETVPAAERKTKQKASEGEKVLLVVCLIACLLPMVMGLRLWDQIPERVSSGLTSEADEAIPRYVMCIFFPIVMALLQLFAYATIRSSRKHNLVPTALRQAVAHWGFPGISAVFVSGYILQSAGQLTELGFLALIVAGLLLLIQGSRFWDCKKTARFAYHTAATDGNDLLFAATHRFAAWVWYAGGLALLAFAMFGVPYQWPLIGVLAVCGVLPALYAGSRTNTRL